MELFKWIVIGLIVITAGALIVYLLYKPSKSTFTPQNKNHNFTRINKLLDNEHNDIFNAIDNLYSACEKHWHTENNLYKKGVNGMPNDHVNVTDIWKEHTKEHNSLLKRIKQMKQDIKNHIDTMDKPHFHWVNLL